jgi:hypothetical protein
MHQPERRTNSDRRRRVDELIAQVRAAEQAVVARGLDAVHPRDGFAATQAHSRQPTAPPRPTRT